MYREMELHNLVEQLMVLYYECYPSMERISININFTDDLGKKHCELRPDMKKRLIAEGLESQQNCNGRMVAPYNINDTMHILLNTKKVIQYCKDDSMTWVGTFAHELTHAIDFYQMARKENLQSYDPLLEYSLYSMFQFWTEYHARKLGYGFLRKFLGVDKNLSISTQQRVEYIQSIEWLTHKQAYFEEFHQNTNVYNQINTTMQLLGRYSVWCDLFPHNFNENIFAEEFSTETWMLHLFSFMREHETLDKIYGNFDSMKSILLENWSL